MVPEDEKIDYPMFLFCEGSGKDLHQKIEIAENIIPSTTSFTGNGTYDDDLDECEEFELVQWDIYHWKKKKKKVYHVLNTFMDSFWRRTLMIIINQNSPFIRPYMYKGKKPIDDFNR